MAHLWIKREGEWGAKKLSGAHVDITGAALVNQPGSGLATEDHGAALLMRVDAVGMKLWALVVPARSGVRVNGRPVPAGLRVLSDRDEIRDGGEVSHFSTEELATVVPFPGADHPVICCRCRQPIEAGTPAVSCPKCSIAYHQTDELPCFTYAEKCVICGGATTLGAGFAWVPEED